MAWSKISQESRAQWIQTYGEWSWMGYEERGKQRKVEHDFRRILIVDIVSGPKYHGFHII